jgi:hypothetical protein
MRVLVDVGHVYQPAFIFIPPKWYLSGIDPCFDSPTFIPGFDYFPLTGTLVLKGYIILSSLITCGHSLKIRSVVKVVMANDVFS